MLETASNSASLQAPNSCLVSVFVNSLYLSGQSSCFVAQRVKFFESPGKALQHCNTAHRLFDWKSN